MIHFLPSDFQRAIDAARSLRFDSVRHAKSESLRRSHSDLTRFADVFEFIVGQIFSQLEVGFSWVN